jgi:hypothetical protein
MPLGQAQAYLETYQGIYISYDAVNDTAVLVWQGLREKQEEEIQQVWEESELPACKAASSQRLYVSADGINHLLPGGQGKEKVASAGLLSCQ